MGEMSILGFTACHHQPVWRICNNSVNKLFPRYCSSEYTTVNWLGRTGKDRTLGFDPCNLTWFGAKCESVALCGSNKMCQLYNSEGMRLACVNKQQSWIWCCSTRQGYNQIVSGLFICFFFLSYIIFKTISSI
ncbi:unnamed protein product [Trichobilharzia regenti]|nr:unnamed protein product [Trichobilharzia regenti]